MTKENSIFLVPCSGMGKVHGLLGREAALKVVGELRPEETELACLAEIVTQDEEIQKRMKGRKAITIDGCPLKCAEKNVCWVGGEVYASLRAVDAFRNHRGVQAGSATELTDGGWLIADDLAETVAVKVDEALQGGNQDA